jgi:hypothetical protein
MTEKISLLQSHAGMSDLRSDGLRFHRHRLLLRLLLLRSQRLLLQALALQSLALLERLLRLHRLLLALLQELLLLLSGARDDDLQLQT